MPSIATPAAWNACLDAFSRELTPQQFVTWIQPLACRHEGAGLTLTAPNRFVLQWVRDRFGPRIAALATEASGAPVNVEYAVADVSKAVPAAPPLRPDAISLYPYNDTCICG
jgi:chromosomal replication initiator protein